MTVEEIARVTDGEFFSNEPATFVKGFSIDSRTISPGQFFIAIRGKDFDGHDFVADAAKKDAAGAIVERQEEACRGKGFDHIIVVEDTRKAMGRIAAEIRRRVNIPVVCITGSNGKTTAKDILAHVLSSGRRVLSSARSYNNIIGLSLTLFDLDGSYDIAVLELGTSRPGEMPVLAEIARPEIAVVTNIGDAHLKYFVDREGVFLEKMSILDFMTDTGMIFLNRDDCLLARAAVRGSEKRFYGFSPGCDFMISGLSRRDEGYDFSLNGNRFFLPVDGEHNVYNAAAAVAVAEYLGMEQESIREALKSVSLPKMRLEKVDAGGITFINDSYNANPDSFECALKVLQDARPAGKKGVVAGDMLELGRWSDEFHRAIGKSIASKDIDFLITLGENARNIADSARESGMDKEKALSAASHEDAAEMVRSLAGPGTVVLLKGSRMAKMEEILKCFTTSCTH